jgi:hypothetical protein
MTGKLLKELMRRERTNLWRNFGVCRLLSAKEGPDEVTITVEIADSRPAKCAELAKYLEVILDKKVKVIAKTDT